jgi:hypothetical protein
VAKLTKKERARLPDRAVAYVNSQGHRRLPIDDKAHVRNALRQVRSRRVRRRRRRAAGAQTPAERREEVQGVPVGFVTGQVRKLRSRSSGVERLPTGSVTFLETAGMNVSLRSFARIDT